MNNRFYISDTHFGHESTCTKFVKNDGTPLRPFVNAQEMDEEMVRRWNDVVKEHDTVYHLGDVVIARRHLSTLSRLNGRKILIKGNHDIFKLKDYLEHFEDIRGVNVNNDFICSHIPLSHECITERFNVNVHGHLHANTILLNGKPDPRYFSVCVEQIDFRPIEHSELVKRINERKEEFERTNRKTFKELKFGNSH